MGTEDKSRKLGQQPLPASYEKQRSLLPPTVRILFDALMEGIQKGNLGNEPGSKGTLNDLNRAKNSQIQGKNFMCREDESAEIKIAALIQIITTCTSHTEDEITSHEKYKNAGDKIDFLYKTYVADSPLTQFVTDQLGQSIPGTLMGVTSQVMNCNFINKSQLAMFEDDPSALPKNPMLREPHTMHFRKEEGEGKSHYYLEIGYSSKRSEGDPTPLRFTSTIELMPQKNGTLDASVCQYHFEGPKQSYLEHVEKPEQLIADQLKSAVTSPRRPWFRKKAPLDMNSIVQQQQNAIKSTFSKKLMSFSPLRGSRGNFLFHIALPDESKFKTEEQSRQPGHAVVETEVTVPYFILKDQNGQVAGYLFNKAAVKEGQEKTEMMVQANKPESEECVAPVLDTKIETSFDPSATDPNETLRVTITEHLCPANIFMVKETQKTPNHGGTLDKNFHNSDSRSNSRSESRANESESDSGYESGPGPGSPTPG